jgi:ABC-type multidrug transport system fused ATPase/permease subunit
VGSSGAGKSTFGDLLLGILRTSEGSIFLNGIKQELFHNKEWQSLVGYVPQESLLLDCSIKENIAFGVPKDKINLELLWQCVKVAAIDSFVKNLPHGLDTHVGDKGIKLSGGQKQRITIARALYAQPKILIFDEATSALDSITEEEISQAIERLSHSMALVIIAHRIQTVKNADVIFLFEEGQIIASGTYDELYRNSEKFQQLVGV